MFFKKNNETMKNPTKNHIFYSSYKNYIAFTLAEVLITLLIIGVISSIVIPGIIQDTQNAELKIAWKKAYGSLVQTYKLAVLDDSSVFAGYNCYDGSGRNIFNALKNTMGYIKECNGNTLGNCWASSGVTPDTAVGSGCSSGFYVSNQNAASAFVAKDGSFWLLYSGTSFACPIIAVDINGNKGPNQWNKDVLSFQVSNNKIYLGSCVLNPNSIEYLK